MTPDDVTYFLNIATIAATLLGLTFIALSFFLVDLLRRYEGTALPVVRHRDKGSTGVFAKMRGRPESLTDHELLDGDPLFVFIAFSVAVTWNLFLLPLTIGLTAAWADAGLSVLTVELLAFLGMLTFSFYVRNKKIDELKPYLTREELLWHPLGRLALVLYAAATLVVALAALSVKGVGWAHALSGWALPGATPTRIAVSVLKAVCLAALLLGTYTVNKDMFIFFKSVASERMRLRWLSAFLTEKYPKLKAEVDLALSDVRWDSVEELRELWRGGCPRMLSTHETFRNASPECVSALWQELVERRNGDAGWILDIPSIAHWAEEVEASLEAYGAQTAARDSLRKGKIKAEENGR